MSKRYRTNPLSNMYDPQACPVVTLASVGNDTPNPRYVVRTFSFEPESTISEPYKPKKAAPHGKQPKRAKYY
jgi:hypothetical protein